jgi:ATP-dependent Zn protease
MSKPRRRRTKRELRTVAYHEAGHAVVVIELHLGLRSATIRKDIAEGFSGLVRHYAMAKKDRIDKLLTVLVAGCAAERRAGFAHLDLWTALGDAKPAVDRAARRLNLSADTRKVVEEIVNRKLPGSDANQCRTLLREKTGMELSDGDADAAVAPYIARAKKILNRRWPVVEDVAAELLKCRTVSADRIHEIYRVHVPYSPELQRLLEGQDNGRLENGTDPVAN